MNLRQGDCGEPIAEIRAWLEYLGLLSSPSGMRHPTEGVEIVFDAEIDLAVRTFQQERGLTVDGVVGPRPTVG